MGSEGRDPPILNLSTRRRTVTIFIAPPLHLQRKIPRYFLYRCLAVKKTESPLLGTEPQICGSRTHSLVVTTATKGYISFSYTILGEVPLAVYKLRKQANKQIGLWEACVLMEQKTNKQR